MPFEPCFIPPPPPPDPVYERRIQAMKEFASELASSRGEIVVDRYYRKILITYPQPNDHIHDDGTGIRIAIFIEPELGADLGHLIQILVDGATYGEGSTETVQLLPGLERGYHTVAAQVIDSQGNILSSSAPVRFDFQRPSHIFNAPFLVPAPGPVGAAPNVTPGWRNTRVPPAPQVKPFHYTPPPPPSKSTTTPPSSHRFRSSNGGG